MDDLNAAPLDDIKQCYRSYYGANNAVLALAGDITAARALELVTKYFGVIAPAPPLPRLALIDRTLLPALGENADPVLPPVLRATLRNGVKVMLIERHGVPLVHVALALELTDKGSRSRNAFPQAAAFESLGARFGAATSADSSVLRLRTSSSRLLPALALMADAALHPAFSQDQLVLAQQRAQPTALVARIYLVDKPGAPQSVIAAGQSSLRQGQPDDLAMDPVMSNFGGMATSRLNRNLRLDKHWSYGTSGA